jgi:hypothetical protein
MSVAFNLTQEDPAMPDGPVSDPAAWTGPELQKSTTWQYRLSESDISELDVALAEIRKKDLSIMEIAKSDFILPRFGEKLREFRNDLINGRGFILLRNAPVDRYSKADIATIYWGIGTHLGYSVSQNARGHHLGHVTDLGIKSMKSASQDEAVKEEGFIHTEYRAYMSSERIFFHIDFADIVGLLCLHPAKSGGLSVIVSALAIHNEIMKRRPDLLRVLYEPFWVDRRRELPAGARPYYLMPIFHYVGGRMSAHYPRAHIQTAQSFPEVPRLTLQQIEALDLVNDLANDPAFHLTMVMEKGDIQYLNNHVILHSRTKYEDFPEKERKRYLLRLWLVTPDGRPLSHWFYEQFGGGRRGGIYVPGATEVAPLDP